ncbi:hypothetical protein RUM44_003572 [Polyplax serrata]|uniref:Uncharacterized protein n=1 Tax=Polyplax serrata TaxID=468196 RepID=A0ABR1AGU4_POLSC
MVAVKRKLHIDQHIDATQAPRFVSRGQTFRVVIGDTLVLPCEVDNLVDSWESKEVNPRSTAFLEKRILPKEKKRRVGEDKKKWQSQNVKGTKGQSFGR